MTGTLLDANVAHDDIRDIRGPIELPSPFPWALLIASALGAVVVLLAVARIVRRIRARQPSAYELSKLRLHEASLRAGSERADVLAEQVSGAVRAYVEARFAVRAAHRTTEDFLAELLTRADTQLASYRAELERFLATCDLAKFAGRELPLDLRRELCSDAVRFIEAAELTLRRGEPA